MSGEDSRPGSWEQGGEISQPGPRRKRKKATHETKYRLEPRNCRGGGAFTSRPIC